MNKFSNLLGGILLFDFKYRYSIISLSVFGFSLSITQVFGVSRDYENYEEFFNLVRIGGYAAISESRFEPGFSILGLFFIGIFNTNLSVYGSFVLISMLMKGSVIGFYSSSQKIFIIVALFYGIRYFPLHELTQLRLSIGMGLILFGSVLLWSGRVFLGCIVCSLALLFHASTAAIIPILLISQSNRWRVILFALIIFAFSFYSVSFFYEYLSGFIEILSDYEENKDQFEISPNPIAVYILMDLAMIIWSLFYWGRLSEIMRRIVFVELVGFSIFYGVIDFSVVAIRVRELYSVFWIIYAIEGLKKRATAMPVFLFIIANILFYFYLFFLYEEIPFFTAI